MSFPEETERRRSDSQIAREGASTWSFTETVAPGSNNGAPGVVPSAQGRLENSAASLDGAESPEPDVPAVDWLELGLTQAASFQFADAARSFARALVVDPHNIATRVNLGNAVRLIGHLTEAESVLRIAVELGPEVVEARDNLGLVLTSVGCHEEALACHDACLEKHPGRAQLHVHKGLVLKALHRVEEADAAFVHAIELDRDCAQAFTQLGLLRSQRGDREGALRCHLAASALRPTDPEACNNLGNALRLLGQVDEAVACFERALRIEPDFAEAMNNLAITRLQHGRVQEATGGFSRALELYPGFAEAHVNLAHARLGLGELARGWPEFEWRRKLPDSRVGTLPGPEWDGADLQGRVILVHAEQGQGDTLQFVRFAAQAQARGARVWLKVPGALMSLLARCPGVDRVLGIDEPTPEASLHIAMMSLPGLLGINQLAEGAGRVPYLFVDEQLCQVLQPQLRCGERLRVGISWQSNSRFPEDWHRSIPLKEFLPLSRVGGAQCFVLQRGPGLDQISALPDAWKPRSLDVPDLGEWRWEHTAAVIRHLDLVITSDSAIAHLAGAMGRPVWVALSAAADWRWLRDRDDSPWCPTMRLFRQTTWRNWDDVFDRIAEALISLRAELPA